MAYSRTYFTVNYAVLGVAAHEVRRSDVKRSKGGVIGTGGKGVISLRADHGVDVKIEPI